MGATYKELLKFRIVEVIKIDALDFDSPRSTHSDIEADHQVRQLISVYQNQAEMPGLARDLDRRPGERRGSYQDTLLCPFADQGTHKGLHRLAANCVPWLVTLGLQVNPIKAELVLTNYPINATVASAAQLFAGVGPRTAISHRQKEIHDQLLKECRVCLQHTRQQSVP